MTLRRRDLLLSSLAVPLLACSGGERAAPSAASRSTAPGPVAPPIPVPRAPPRTPVVAATWRWGRTVCTRAHERLAAGAPLIDAIEAGIRDVELDPGVTSVGYGGYPNEAGVVQLDAMMMKGSTLDAGAIGALEQIATPLSVARRVMERTRHVFLVGAGALEFARSEGFESRELLTDEARAAWERWKSEGSHGFRRGPADHDTVGSVGVDGSGEVIAALSTSGLAWKMPGRVGDSPLVGAGGYADAEVGAACATGVGEEVIRIAGAHAIVERMRAGDEPTAAAEAVLRRLVRRRGAALGDAQVGVIALRRDGVVGAAALRPGFELAILRDGQVAMQSIAPLTP